MRRFHCFAAGLPRSGNEALHRMFENYKTRHNAHMLEFVNVVMENNKKRIRKFLIGKDDCELDISMMNGFVIEHLVELFPNSKFILTVRDCITWLYNAIDHRNNCDENLQLFFDWIYSDGMNFDAEELPLRINNVYPMRNYLKIWAEYNRKVVNTVPKDQLLILRYFQNQKDEIVDFLKIPQKSLKIGYELSSAESIGISVTYLRKQLECCAKERKLLGFN